MRNKKPVFYTVIILLLLLLSFWGIKRYICRMHYARATEMLSHTEQVFSSSPGHSTITSLFFAKEGNTLFEITNDHSLFQLRANSKDKLSSPGQFSSPFITESGLAYIRNHTLFCQSDHTHEVIATSVAAACWDGLHYVWLDSETASIMTLKDAHKETVFQLDPSCLGSPILLIASSEWIVVSPAIQDSLFNSTYIIRRSTAELTTYPLCMDGRDAAFLCENKLVKIGGAQDTFCVLDLLKMEKTDYQTDLIATQGNVTASAAYNKEKNTLLISACSRPERPEFYDENGGTYLLDLQNGSIEKLSNQYYPLLCFEGNRLWGITDGFWGLQLYKIA